MLGQCLAMCPPNRMKITGRKRRAIIERRAGPPFTNTLVVTNMSLPSAVFLDTSVFAGQQYNFSSTALASFIPVAKKQALKLLLPDPTEREIVRQIRERSKEALKALDEARRRAPFLAKWKHFPPRMSLHITDWEVMRIAMAEWQEFLKQFDLLKLGYADVDVKKVMQWYDSISAPFREGKKRKEFPDAFAIAIVEAYARKNNFVVAVVSEDTDFKPACDRFSSLLYFKSLPTLTELLLTDAAKTEKLREAILEDLSAIETSLFEEADNLEYYHNDSDYTVRRSKIHGASITDVRIVALGAGECTLTFDAELEAEHLLKWNEWGHEHGETEEQEEWIIETSPVTGTAKVSLDASSNKINDVTYIETDIAEVAVTENPRRRW